MARIYKRGRVWYLDIRAKGRRVRRRIGNSKKVALLALQDAIVKVEREEFGFARKDMSVDRFVERYLKHSAANHRASTTNRYRAVTDHFQQFLSSKRSDVVFLSQINQEVIDQYVVYRKEAWVNPNGYPVESDDQVTDGTRKGARAHTINFELSALKTVFNTAIKWEYLRENPAKGVKKLKVEDAKPVRFLTEEESHRFLKACPEELQPIYFTFLNTGMRKAELENLTWADVDFDRRRILIRSKEGWQPKTGEREIPISATMFDLLTDQRGRNSEKVASDYVFEAKNSGRSHNMLRNELIKIAQKAEIEDLTKVHTLRHTFASHLVMKGVDLPTVMKLMGHSDIDTTMIYAHLAPDHLQDAVDKLSF